MTDLGLTLETLIYETSRFFYGVCCQLFVRFSGLRQ